MCTYILVVSEGSVKDINWLFRSASVYSIRASRRMNPFIAEPQQRIREVSIQAHGRGGGEAGEQAEPSELTRRYADAVQITHS